MARVRSRIQLWPVSVPDKTNRLTHIARLVEARVITRTLIQTNHNVSQAAKILGVNRTDLYKRIARLGLSVEGQMRKERSAYEEKMRSTNLAIREFMKPYLTNANE